MSSSEPGYERILIDPAELYSQDSDGESVYNEAFMAEMRKRLLAVDTPALQTEKQFAIVCTPLNEADVSAYRLLYRRCKKCTALRAWILGAACPQPIARHFTEVMQEANPAIGVLQEAPLLA
jgi:hypothetical protein